VGVGPRVGIEVRDGRVAFGAEVRVQVVRLASWVRLDLGAAFDWYTRQGSRLILGLSGEALLAITPEDDVLEPYVGAGAGVRTSGCTGCADLSGNTEAAASLIFGAKLLPRGRVQPFVELKFTLGAFDPILLAGGVLITF